MKHVRTYTSKAWMLFIVLAAALLAGCTRQAVAETTGAEAGYTGALVTSYEAALDVTGQLALGTLELEGTEYAVTEEQAAKLLPLWQVLSGNDLQSDTEREAVVRQIEATMSEAQVSAIAAMQLVQDDAQTWAQEQGGATAASGGQARGERQMPAGASEEQIAQMREQFQNMSPEEQATLRVQFNDQSGPTGQAWPMMSGISSGLIDAVTDLLSARSGKAVAQVAAPAVTSPAAAERTSVSEPTLASVTQSVVTPESAPEPSSELAVYVVQAGDTLAAIAQAYGVAVEAIVEANDIQDPDAIQAGQGLTILDPAQVPAMVEVALAAPAEERTVAAAVTWPGWSKSRTPIPAHR